MAYMDFTLGNAQRTAAFESPTAFAPATIDFTPTEWAVVNLARHDSLASLWSSTLFTRATAWLFGLKPAQPLANPRLENLRRLAVVAWHRRARNAAREIRRFLSAGFSQEQARLLISTIEGRHQLAELRGGVA